MQSLNNNTKAILKLYLNFIYTFNVYFYFSLKTSSYNKLHTYIMIVCHYSVFYDQLTVSKIAFV